MNKDGEHWIHISGQENTDSIHNSKANLAKTQQEAQNNCRVIAAAVWGVSSGRYLLWSVLKYTEMMLVCVSRKGKCFMYFKSLEDSSRAFTDTNENKIMLLDKYKVSAIWGERILKEKELDCSFPSIEQLSEVYNGGMSSQRMRYWWLIDIQCQTIHNDVIHQLYSFLNKLLNKYRTQNSDVPMESDV